MTITLMLSVFHVPLCARFYILVKLWVTEWPPIGKIAVHSACDMFSEYKYLIVNLVFPTSVIGVETFPDHCLPLPLQYLPK